MGDKTKIRGQELNRKEILPNILEEHAKARTIHVNSSLLIRLCYIYEAFSSF